MKPNSLYAQLELIETPPAGPSASGGAQTDYSMSRAGARLKTRLSSVASALLAYFCGSLEPRMWVQHSGRGETLFVAYDPVSQQRHTFGSEQELRIWAERRYYQ